ncbi:cation:proton antiporter subunit C [Hyphobacterium sp.]|uniref:cation:proton antiporter subunit C n=1 Tax=Hyphobacterium sp. TaxID=2004662 RepID=UPI00374824B1
MIEILAERFNFIIVIILMMTGLYAVVATGNLVKRLVGLSLFQTSVFLLYITIGKVFGGQPPILPEYSEGHGGEGEYGDGLAATTDHGAAAANASSDIIGGSVQHPDPAYATTELIYSNPLPHVLILTAIVVGVATLAVGLALVVRIRESYGTIEDEAINRADYAVDSARRNT